VLLTREVEHMTSLSRGAVTSELFKRTALEKQGRRECRTPDAPASRVCRDSGCCAHALVRSHRKSPGIPRAVVYGLLRALPGDRALLSPSPLRSLLPKNLTPASRHQNHTTSPSARKAPSSLALLASTASCPASVTISSRPSVGQDGHGYKLICVFGKSEYFCKRGWTEGAMNCPGDLPVGSIGCIRIQALVGRFGEPTPTSALSKNGMTRTRISKWGPESFRGPISSAGRANRDMRSSA
jgi:hypothetical protein